MPGHKPHKTTSRRKPAPALAPKRPDNVKESARAPTRETPPIDKFEERGPVGGYGGAGPDEDELE